MNPVTHLETFESISLETLDAKADMLTRTDNKYIVRGLLSPECVNKLQKEFDVLTIDDHLFFKYHSIYFDTNLVCFDEYKKGKRQRFKARTRVYEDSKNLAFFEVKLSGKGAQTAKFRTRCDTSEHGTVTPHFLNFLKEMYYKQYRKEFTHTLSPVVSTSYKRVTLVAKKGGERLTIDFDLVFTVEGEVIPLPHDFAICEAKSKNGNGLADKILHAERIHPVFGCSKFGLAVALSGRVSRYNKFLPVLKKHFKERLQKISQKPLCVQL